MKAPDKVLGNRWNLKKTGIVTGEDFMQHRRIPRGFPAFSKLELVNFFCKAVTKLGGKKKKKSQVIHLDSHSHLKETFNCFAIN